MEHYDPMFDFNHDGHLSRTEEAIRFETMQKWEENSNNNVRRSSPPASGGSILEGFLMFFYYYFLLIAILLGCACPPLGIGLYFFIKQVAGK